jgi:hypothetical protein
MPRLSFCAGILAVLAMAAPAEAAGRGDPSDPNWPCVQRKVPEIDLGAVWTGPAIDPASLDWRSEPGLPEFVAYLAQRRVTLEEADAAIEKFASEDPARRNERLTLLFAGLFDRLNLERKDVMNGIDRFATKQRRMADGLKARNTELETMRHDGKTEFDVLQAKTDEIMLENRIFDERQRSLTYVCEVPVLVEQRLFHLGKTIAAAIKP